MTNLYLSLVQKVIDTTGIRSEESRNDNIGPTTAQSKLSAFRYFVDLIDLCVFCFQSLEYGYGFLSIFVISALSLFGILLFPLTKKPYYKYINAFFTGLAIGALYANSAFELIPAVRIYIRNKLLFNIEE